MPEENALKRCYDCGQETADWIMESRCTGGDSHSLHASYSYTQVPVHSDRRVCANLREHMAEDEHRTSVAVYALQISALIPQLLPLLDEAIALYRKRGITFEDVQAYGEKLYNIVRINGGYRTDQAGAIRQRLEEELSKGGR